jgi:hypothetical protein
LLAVDRFSDTPHKRDIDKRIHRIGRRRDEDHRDAASRHTAFGRVQYATLFETFRDPLGLDAAAHQCLLDQYLGATVQRRALQDHVTFRPVTWDYALAHRLPF